MSKYFSQISDGPLKKRGARIIIGGHEKVGKTTLTTNAPRPLYIPLETGEGSIRVRTQNGINNYSDVLGFLDEVFHLSKRKQFPFHTLSWDSMTALERFMNAAALKADDPNFRAKLGKAHTMETAHGGYGKAYAVVKNYFDDFRMKCDYLAQEFGINMVFTCHTFSSKVMDPAHGEYYTYDLLLHSPKNEKNYGMREYATQWVDLVGFLHEPMFLQKNDGDKIVHAVTSGMGRHLAVDRAPQWVAGNRYNMSGTIPIPKVNGWNALALAIYNSTNGIVDIGNHDVRG